MADAPLLVVRADADARIGAGHLMRALALAQGWEDAGGRALMATRCREDDMPSSVRRSGIESCAVAAEPGSAADAAWVSALAARRHAAWIACDGYHFDAAYTGALRRAGQCVMLVDDLADAAAYDADLILNQNIFAERLAYPPSAGPPLLGTAYALLRREFRVATRPARAGVHRVLITMGGADAQNASLEAMRAVRALEGASLDVKVVAGSSNPHVETLEREAAAMPGTSIVKDPDDMPSLMAWADVAISAGGSTCWELCYLGVPMVLVTTSGNQTGITAGLAEAGAAVHVGRAGDVDAAVLTRALRRLRDDEPGRLAMAARAQALVDGYGARRVSSVLMEQRVSNA